MSNGYARLKNDFWHSPKIMRALDKNPAAIGYYVAGISYSSDNLTDGHLSETAVFYALRVPDEIIEWLTDEGFWECLEDGGWAIHDYLEHQNSREKIEHARKKDAQRKRTPTDGDDGIQSESERNPNGIRSDLTQNPKPKTQNPSDSSYEESHTTRVRESEDNPLTPQEQGYFDTFWNLYPKKQGKRDAMFAFKHALRRAHGATAIIAGVTRFASDPNRPPDGDRYLRSPKNWLEGDCWKDTTYTPTTTRTQPSRQQTNRQHNLDLVAKFEAQETVEAVEREAHC